MVTNTADTLPIMNQQIQLSCIVVNMETTLQADLLKGNADNIWFVLGAYFFAFFPWAIMNNIDFISEKWRTCRRTRNLAHIHLASSILPIIYVAVYAEAQRRDNDYKEFGAALAALMFNVFQLLRTVMGIVQLNAFVAWCENAMECMRALSGKEEEGDPDDRDSMSEMSEQRRSGRETRNLPGLLQLEIFVMWCKRGMARTCEYMRGDTQNCERDCTEDEEDIEQAGHAHVNDVDDEGDEDIEENIEVNNAVIDNELGGREVTVVPSLEKMCDGLKRGSFTPSRWLQTDRVMLSTVRWCGAYLCGIGEQWSVEESVSRKGSELLEKFFSGEMFAMFRILQSVEWNIELENGDHELMSIHELASYGLAELSGEMTTAYGTSFGSYDVWGTYNVELYSFEFDNLVGSYPASDTKSRSGNRESVKVGLAHSVVLAKHLGVEKLKAIRQYYDRYRVPSGSLRGNAFRLLRKQMDSGISDDAEIWEMFESIVYKIPLFPYRMQAIALWDEATNWRVLQASAHQDIWISLEASKYLEIENEEKVLNDAPCGVDIFDFCAEWTTEHVPEKGSLGVVIETVRTFLAEWIAQSGRNPVWEPDVPKESFEFGLHDTSISLFSLHPSLRRRLIWVCQRELQRKVAKAWRNDENLPGNVALIMLFMLSFPLLSMTKVQHPEIGLRESRGEVERESAVPSSNRDRDVNVSLQVWCVWSVLAPQDISLILQVDLTNRAVSLRLRNNNDDGRFIWQDWVDAAMGCMNGFEEDEDSDSGYGRRIVKADLRKPIVELCPLRVDEYSIDAAVEKTGTARIWMGWPPFDMRFCKFELEQWLAACDINLNRELRQLERWATEYETSRIEGVIQGIISEENKEVERSTQRGEDGEGFEDDQMV